RPDLHSEPRFALRLCAERTIARARVGASINFTRNAELFVNAINAGESISQHVVLRKQLGRCSENRKPDIAERVEASIVPELLANEDRSEGVCLIETDTLSLARIRELHAKTKAERRTTTRFVTQLEFGCEREVTSIVGRVCAWSQR